MGGFLIFGILIIVILLAGLGWSAAPKGDNQVVVRSSILASLICCYLMWAIVYLAQLNPLIQPKRSDLRQEHPYQSL